MISEFAQSLHKLIEGCHCKCVDLNVSYMIIHHIININAVDRNFLARYFKRDKFFLTTAKYFYFDNRPPGALELSHNLFVSYMFPVSYTHLTLPTKRIV